MVRRVDVNSADKAALMTIKGVGRKTADRILEARARGTTINSVDELKAVAPFSSLFEESIARGFGLAGAPRVDATFVPEIPNRFVPVPAWRDRVTLPPEINPEALRGFTFTLKLTGPPAVVLGRLTATVTWKSASGGKRAGEGHQYVSFDREGEAEVRLSVAEECRRKGLDFAIVIRDRTGIPVKRLTVRPDAGEVVRIPVMVAEDDPDPPVLVTLRKASNVDYTGYVLSWEVSERAAGRLNERSATLPITRENEALITPPSGATVEGLTVSVRTADGQIAFDDAFTAADLGPADNGRRVLDLVLPAPSTQAFDIKLVEDVNVVTNPYADHELVVAYDVLDPETLNIVWSGKTRFPIDADGRASVALAHYGLVERLTLSVRAPGGETLSERTGTVAELLATNPVTIKVPPRELIADLEAFVRLPRRPDKALCRLLDPSGDRVHSDVQVIFYVSEADPPAAESYAPLLSVRSENNGYFVIDLPQQSFTGAFARVGVKQGSKPFVDVPIVLDMAPVQRIIADEVVTTNEGFLPGKILLVVGSDAPDKKPCCDDCAQSFSRDRAVLDEFSFFTVVRTSEPEIRGYTLSENGEISIRDITDLVPNAEGGGLPPGLAQATVRKDVLLRHTSVRKGLTVSTLHKAIEASNALRLRDRLQPRQQNRAPGRSVLDFDSAIDWDEDPTIYQAVSLAHGHLLQFKQEWISDGFSLGDIVYSLPLAPGQKKQIVVLDWEHRAAAGRSEQLDYAESLTANLTRDRDINEVVAGAVSESIRGGSTAKTSAFGGGFGLGAVVPAGPVPLGGLLGVAGGSSKASSRAWQNSARETTMTSAQSLRDRTSQSAAAVRSQRATVIETATQGERFSVQTESVANYNHCHSLTIQYYEVLRHMRVEQRLASVQECLFIPLLLSPFTHEKALRWREALGRRLIDRRLLNGFEAIERIENDYEGADLPEERWADADVEALSGEFRIEFRVGVPSDIAGADGRENLRDALKPFTFFCPSILGKLDDFLEADAKRRQELFETLVAPEIAVALVQNLRFEARIDQGNGTEQSVALPLDATLVSRYQSNRSLYVSVRQSGPMPFGLTRSEIAAINIRKANSITLSDGSSLLSRIPATANVIVHSGSMVYRTEYMQRRLFASSRIRDDLLGYSSATGQIENDHVRIQTPLSRAELRNPRQEDVERAAKLQRHLNDNLEYYHQAIWLGMSAERRFMFLDGIQVRDYSERDLYPGGVIRSVASVVENEVIGIVGNSLVMPVAPGFRLDPSIRGAEIDLLSLYKPQTPMDPIRISLPTKGVFAEAVMGRCNSCERIEEDRFWRWSEEPIPDSPTQINPISTEPRVQQGPDPSPTPFQAPIIAMQNAPAAPDPQGIAAAMQLLSNPNLFRDITGLTENQRNAIAAFQSSLSTAKAFGDQAAQLTTLAAKLKAVADARKNNAITKEEEGDLTKQFIDQEIKRTERDLENAGNNVPVSRNVTDEFISRNVDAPTSRLEVTREADGSERMRFEVDRGDSGVTPRDRGDTAPRGDDGGPRTPDPFGRGGEPESDQAATPEHFEDAADFDGSAAPAFGPDRLAEAKPSLALLTAYVSQYDGDREVPALARRTFALGAMRGLGQKLRFEHLDKAMQAGPQPMSWLFDHATGLASSPFSAYLAAHNHLRLMAFRPEGFGYEGMSLPWERVEGECTTETAVYYGRRYFDIEGTSFEDVRFSLPKGGLSEEAFFLGRDAKAKNASGFYVVNLREDGIFRALADEFGEYDPNDRYHFLIAATVAEAILSGSVSELFSAQDVVSIARELASLDVTTLKENGAALIYTAGIHAACLLFRDNLIGTLNAGGGKDEAGVRAWYYMNALSFFEGAVFGNHHNRPFAEHQKATRRESRVHMNGVKEAIARNPSGFNASSLRWAVPVSSLVRDQLKPRLMAIVDDVAKDVVGAFEAGISIAALGRLSNAFDTLTGRLPQELGVLTGDMWPYVYEVLSEDGSISVPFAVEPGGASVPPGSEPESPIAAGSPEHAALVSLSGANITGPAPRLTADGLAGIVNSLASWAAIGLPNDSLRVALGWVDGDAAGSELVDPAHLAGQAVLLRAESGDPAALGRLEVWARLLVGSVRSGIYRLPSGQSEALLQLRLGPDGARLTRETHPAELIDAAAAAAKNAILAASVGWEAYVSEIVDFFGLPEVRSEDETLARKLAEYQDGNGLPVTGELDARTWDVFAPDVFRDTDGTRDRPAALPAAAGPPVLHTVDANAWLRDGNDPTIVLRNSDSSIRLLELDRLVIATGSKAFVENGKTKTALEVEDAESGQQIGWTLESNLRFFWCHNLPADLADTPSAALPTAALSGARLKIAEHWNLYGGIFEALFTLELGAAHAGRGKCLALAILAKEGKLFVTNDTATPARPTIRFENHKFHDYWIRDPENAGAISASTAGLRRARYDAHFKPRSGWRNHKYCVSGDCQATEWLTLHPGGLSEVDYADRQHAARDVAAALADQETAHRAASYGAFQTLGAGHRAYNGYASARALYAAYFDGRAQFVGLIDFLNTKVYQGKTLMNWVSDPGFGTAEVWARIAGGYNGDGRSPDAALQQGETVPYARGLRSHYAEAKALLDALDAP